nr:bifunctional diaminohydroxyphosphoribosylaminopyrimidine deaminase/5-amino-6-(5-phosphoribosylamino)uracil reductase RibD [Solimonas sp. K1W22B-7]
MQSQEAAQWMARALRLAEQGRYGTHPNPRVGCVIVRDGEVVGEGWHQRAGEPHAEVYALREAGERARGAEVFVTLEPCSHHGRTPPCADALVQAGVSRVWSAMQDPNPLVAGQGLERLRAAGIATECGLLEKDAQRLNRGFVSRMTRGRPFLVLKLAASLDGRTAMASGESQWITGAEARADVHRLRAETGAVMTGPGTVLADDPQLTVRITPVELGAAIHGATAGGHLPPATPSMASPAGGNSAIQGTVPYLRQPDRIVLDTRAQVPAGAKVWAEGARRLWLTAGAGAAPAGVERLVCAMDSNAALDLAAALRLLGEKQVNEVLLECGPRLAGAFLQSGLVDEVVAYVAPTFLGHEARPFATLPGLEKLSQRLPWRFAGVRQVGADLRLTLQPA